MMESEKEKIKQWLLEENVFNVTEQQNPLTYFSLRIERKQTPSLTIPLFIYTLKEENTDKIIVYWKWSLLPEYQKSLLATGKSAIEVFGTEIQSGFVTMHVSLKLTPNIHTLQLIDANKIIRLDGLTKDRLFDVMNQVHDSFIFILYQSEKHKFFRPSFDPSSLT